MSRDLTNLFIDETFQYLTQISGSNQDILLDGVGNQITELQVTASHATSASYASTASLLQGNAEQVGSIDFAVDGIISQERRLSWNDSAGTLDVGLKGGNVTLQVGQETVTRVVNKSGIDLLEANYQVVSILGAQGNRISVELATAVGVDAPATLGIVTETILINQEGFVTSTGLVRGIDTRGPGLEDWLEGDILYLSPTIPGGITNVRPIAPAVVVKLGNVVSAAPNGSIYVKIEVGTALTELYDVTITSASNGEILAYNATTQLWENLPSSSLQPATSSYAVSSSQADNANTATSASYAVTASYALNAGAGDSFPYTGSAIISGSLTVIGQSTVDGNFIQNIIDTGSDAFRIDALGVGNLNMGIGGFDSPGGWKSSANLNFNGTDTAFFSAENDFYIQNIYSGTGSVNITSENKLPLTGKTGVEIYGGDPFTGIDPQEAVNITGKAFATSIASNINGFSIIIAKDTTVRSNTRAFVETPMQVGLGKTVTVEAGSTLKVINEL